MRTPPMRLTISAFDDGTVIPDKYTQASAAGAVSPELTWNTVPPGTQSFVLYMHDIDVVRNRGLEDYLHWLVWNIPGTAISLPEKMPDGAVLADGSRQISAGGAKYTGPGAPASGPLHHYVFELFALDIKVDVPAGANAADTKTSIMSQIQNHIIGKATYIGKFKRPM
ncbi:MAG TPA: YbhB/YbcL family Raf kinase inhibitor-like protein [Sphingobacteriaceae bacterium]|nr:YbhB/YbcL family Raf kinase inhibitor-like protein [Sphingobacteriaceae bacterium]